MAHVTADVTATHATRKQLSERVKENVYKLRVYNVFLSRDFFRYLTEKKFNCCSAVRPSRNERRGAKLPGCFFLIFRLSYTLTLKMKAIFLSETTVYTRVHGVICDKIGPVCCPSLVGFFLDSHFDPEYGGRKCLRNSSGQFPQYTALHARR